MGCCCFFKSKSFLLLRADNRILDMEKNFELILQMVKQRPTET